MTGLHLDVKPALTELGEYQTRSTMQGYDDTYALVGHESLRDKGHSFALSLQPREAGNELSSPGAPAALLVVNFFFAVTEVGSKAWKPAEACSQSYLRTQLCSPLDLLASPLPGKPTWGNMPISCRITGGRGRQPCCL